MRKYIYPILSGCFLLAIACKTAKPASGNTAVQQVMAQATNSKKEGPYIIAVILKASRKADSSIAFEVFKVDKVPGKLKPGQNDNSGNDYLVSFANSKDIPLTTYRIKDPLNTWVESSDESGELKTVPVKKNEEYISIRTNYSEDVKEILIKKNITDKNEIIIPLNID